MGQEKADNGFFKKSFLEIQKYCRQLSIDSRISYLPVFEIVGVLAKFRFSEKIPGGSDLIVHDIFCTLFLP